MKNRFLTMIMCFGFGAIFAQNTTLGTSVSTAGNRNTHIGEAAGSTNTNITQNYENVAVGHHAGSNSTAGQNVFVGAFAGLNTTAEFNTFIGSSIAPANTSGQYNVFIGGRRAGNSNVTGQANVIIGDQAGLNCNSSFNVFLGSESGNTNVSGENNVGIGRSAGSGNTKNNNVSIGTGAGQLSSGQDNIFMGRDAGASVMTDKNIAIGVLAGKGSGTTSLGNNNIVIGENAGNSSSTAKSICLGMDSGVYSSGNENIFIGADAGAYSSGNRNLAIGYKSGQGLTSGTGNTFLGYVYTASAPTISNSVVLSNNVGVLKFYVDGAGNAALGLPLSTLPQNKLEIKSNFVNNALTSSGLRFTNLKNDIAPVTNPSLLTDKGVLSVNANGDVILVKDQVGISNSCTSANYVTKVADASGNLKCSIIYDDDASVGISSTGSFTYSYPSTVGSMGSITTGTLKLDVNGTMRTINLYATSDKRFKKDIRSIDNALDIVQSLDGKTYFWDKKANLKFNFDDGIHSGFLAQDLEKVIPHVVATDNEGMKSVNYMEIIPYLVEAIKAQQTQIEELKTQIGDNFKSQNSDLINLQNTKIISVSPNPSKDMITVSFNIEESVNSAKLLVHDLNGNVISSLNIADRKNNITRNLEKNNFGNGIYIVSLVINGKSIDTKKIVFN